MLRPGLRRAAVRATLLANCVPFRRESTDSLYTPRWAKVVRLTLLDIHHFGLTAPGGPEPEVIEE